MKPPINSFEDLAAREDINLIILRNTVIGQQLLVNPRNVMFYIQNAVLTEH